VLRDDVDYHELGGDWFQRRADPARITKRLVGQLERLGHTVTLEGLPQRRRDFPIRRKTGRS
jgi:transposase